MKQFTTLAMMALTLSSCTGTLVKADGHVGRVIEYKSGPEGFDTRTYFYEGAQEVVAFDAQFTPALAKESIRHLRTFTKKPITWLVITHPNPDKFNGASVFKAEGARILSSAATAKAIAGVHSYKEHFFVNIAGMFKKGEYPQPTSIDQVFQGRMELVLRGGERIVLQELSQPGVSSTQTVAYVESVNSLFVGDLIHHRAHAWLEGGIVEGQATPTLKAWIEGLEEIASNFPAHAMVYGGRGETAKLGEAVRAQTSYLKRAQSLVREVLATLGSRAADFNGPEAGSLYKQLAKKFETEFPGYGLSYLIEYGAYGLVQSEAAKAKIQ